MHCLISPSKLVDSQSSSVELVEQSGATSAAGLSVVDYIYSKDISV